jgi:hypothetical protein
VPGDQNVFYMAPVHGGVWQTTDFGRIRGAALAKLTARWNELKGH